VAEDTGEVVGMAEGLTAEDTGEVVDMVEGIAEDTAAEGHTAVDTGVEGHTAVDTGVEGHTAVDIGAEGIAGTAAVGGTEEDTDGMEVDIGTVVGIGPTLVLASPQGHFWVIRITRIRTIRTPIITLMSMLRHIVRG